MAQIDPAVHAQLRTCSPADYRLDCGWRSCSPWPVIDAVLAPRPRDQIRGLSTCSPQLLAVSQSLPRPWRIELGPATVVRVITFMRALRKVRHAVGRDQQFTRVRSRCEATFCQSMLTVIAVHLTQVAVGHTAHDAAKPARAGHGQRTR